MRSYRVRQGLWALELLTATLTGFAAAAAGALAVTAGGWRLGLPYGLTSAVALAATWGLVGTRRRRWRRWQ